MGQTKTMPRNPKRPTKSAPSATPAWKRKIISRIMTQKTLKDSNTWGSMRSKMNMKTRETTMRKELMTATRLANSATKDSNSRITVMVRCKIPPSNTTAVARAPMSLSRAVSLVNATLTKTQCISKTVMIATVNLQLTVALEWHVSLTQQMSIHRALTSSMNPWTISHLEMAANTTSKDQLTSILTKITPWLPAATSPSTLQTPTISTLPIKTAPKTWSMMTTRIRSVKIKDSLWT